MAAEYDRGVGRVESARLVRLFGHYHRRVLRCGRFVFDDVQITHADCAHYCGSYFAFIVHCYYRKMLPEELEVKIFDFGRLEPMRSSVEFYCLYVVPWDLYKSVLCK